MGLASTDIQQKRFRTRWLGFDTKEVQLFCQELAEEIENLKSENSHLSKDLQEHKKELREYKEREKTIRAVLLTAHKTAEQTKGNAEKEAKVMIAEAELQAEKILQAAHQRLTRIHDDIAELQRHRLQLEAKLRATVETYRNLLNAQEDDANENETLGKIKILNR
jgi:cell division initiation protein